jgi:hypothetical protein
VRLARGHAGTDRANANATVISEGRCRQSADNPRRKQILFHVLSPQIEQREIPRTGIDSGSNEKRVILCTALQHYAKRTAYDSSAALPQHHLVLAPETLRRPEKGVPFPECDWLPGGHPGGGPALRPGDYFACQWPPRAVATPRAFIAAAISLRVDAPTFCASRTIGKTLAAKDPLRPSRPPARFYGLLRAGGYQESPACFGRGEGLTCTHR